MARGGDQGGGDPNETTLTEDAGSYAYVARYDADGTLAWAKRAGAAGGSTSMLDIATLSDGSVVIAGGVSTLATFGEGEPNETTVTSPGFRYASPFLARYGR